MGLCSSCCNKEETQSQTGESDDRANLIDSSNDCIVSQKIQSENVCANQIKNNARTLEEQADVNKIIQEMATNVIDIGTLGSHIMEQHEYRERMNHYFNKLRTMNTTKVQWSMPNHCILIDIPNPDKILFSDISISKPEYNHICSMLTRLDKSMKHTIVIHKKDILIPFMVS